MANEQLPSTFRPNTGPGSLPVTGEVSDQLKDPRLVGQFALNGVNTGPSVPPKPKK